LPLKPSDVQDDPVEVKDMDEPNPSKPKVVEE